MFKSQVLSFSLFSSPQILSTGPDLLVEFIANSEYPNTGFKGGFHFVKIQFDNPHEGNQQHPELVGITTAPPLPPALSIPNGPWSVKRALFPSLLLSFNLARFNQNSFHSPLLMGSFSSTMKTFIETNDNNLGS